MNDRFKFRYVNELDNKVYEVASINFKFDELYIKIDDYAEQGAYEINPDNLSQCTGLKDKNGTLIYEGDIVKDTETNDIAVIKWDENYIQFIAEEKGGFFCIDFDFSICKKFEVIGNIYENPELLEEQND